MSHVYTIHDTAQTLHRIEADLRVVTQTLRAGDPSLRSIVLTGGFARGEGCVRNGVPQNDYDFVAIRGVGGPVVAYPLMQRSLQNRLGVHIDLAPVQAWRLPWVSRSIFWYETAVSGRVVWGEDLLDRIRIKRAQDLDAGEGLRLLVNRAAGLLLVTNQPRGDAHRLQAAKAILAALDVDLLARGRFRANQMRRYQAFEGLRSDPDDKAGFMPNLTTWVRWAHRYKTDPDRAPPVDPHEAWLAARSAILDAVPTALKHARVRSLKAYGRRDGILDRIHYLRQSSSVPGASRLLAHPTGRVRVATLRLLEACEDGRLPPLVARRHLAGVVKVADDALAMLEQMRRATLQ